MSWHLRLNPYARVKEIAEQCGYSDVNHFTRLFRSQYGLSPKKWRLRPAQEDGQAQSERVSSHQ